MCNVTVREMLPDEASTVLKIGRRAFTGVESLWVGNPKQALVAVKDGSIVGAILYKFIMSGNKKIGYVDYAFTDPAYHNQGVGNLLYQATTEYLWKQGCAALTAVVKDDNVGSWGLLLKNGFCKVSLPQLVRQFGFLGAIKHYFGTPLCFGIGMEYYVAVKDETLPCCKQGSIQQILSFLLANTILLLPSIWVGRIGANAFSDWIAFLVVLLFCVVCEFAGTKFSAHRNWTFRLNNGGGLICALVNFGSIFPMIGRWYPASYEKSKAFRRDMGMTALAGWISLLALVGILFFSGIETVVARSVWQMGVFLLIYRVIPFYPFESFGGRRVYAWNKWIYAVMALATLVVIACTFVFPT